MDDLLEILQDLHNDIDYYTHKTLIDDQVLDSFDIISLIASISEKFDVIIPASEIIPENFNSMQALSALIERLS